MDTDELGTKQVKNEIIYNDFNEAFQTETVENKPCKINIFRKCGRYDDSGNKTDFVDHKNSTSYEQIEEKYATKTLPDPEYTGHSEVCEDMSFNECNSEQIKIENSIDIFYEDIKCEIGEEKSSELYKYCEVCNNNIFRTEFIDSESNILECSCQTQNNLKINLRGEDMTRDVKPFPLILTTDSGLQRLIVPDETVSEDESSNKQVSFAALQRDSGIPSKNNKLKAIKMSDLPEKKMQCSKSFSYPSSLNVHEKIHIGEKTFHCKICSKSYSSKGSLKVHAKIHTGEKPFRCKICSKSFIYLNSLNCHAKIHAGERPFHCKICSKSFMRNGDLKCHLLIHTDKKPFHCNICSKSFTLSRYLKSHETTHREKKPFHCKICSKSFVMAANLRTHSKIHTGEKPFCKICSKSFIYSSSLNAHQKIHAVEKLFHCKICSKSFGGNSNLKSHETIHTAEKPFLCKICSKSFKRKGELKSHFKIHAGGKRCKKNIFIAKSGQKSFNSTGKLGPEVHQVPSVSGEGARGESVYFSSDF